MLIRLKHALLGLLLVAAIGGLSACGGSSSDGVYNQAFDVSGRWSGNISQHNRQSVVPVIMTLAGGATITGTISASGHTCIDDGNVTGTATTAAVNTKGDNPLTVDQENSNLGTVNLAYALTGTSGGISVVTIDSGGTGYTSEPTVTFAEPIDSTGTRAEGIAQVAGGTAGGGGALSSTFTIDGGGGTGYTSIPTVSITAPPAGGTTATAVARIGGTGQVASITADNAGEGYSSVPTVTISAPESDGGTTATAVAVLGDPGRVESIAVNDGGTAYDTGTNTCTIEAPDVSGGVQATCTMIITAGGVVAGVVVNEPGSGYNIIPGVTLSGTVGLGAVGTVTIVGSGAGTVIGINVTNPGSGYIEVPSVTLTGGGGSGATGDALLTTVTGAGTVVAVDLVEPGSGYLDVPAVTITGGGGTGARVTAALTGTAGTEGTVTGVIITVAGSGYDPSDPPLVTFTGGGGTGAVGHGTTLLTSPEGAMTFNLSGTSSQLSGHYSGIWSNSSGSCSTNTSGTISVNRS